MSSNQREEKTYGAIQTDSHMTFKGFCKKIYSKKQQKVNVFIEGEKIDTIKANLNISEIEDQYEVFDTNGFCFEYKVPLQYIGEKYKIEFISEDHHQLLHSPSFIADKRDSKHLFFHSLDTINKRSEKTYKKKHISFFAIKENYTDNKFINFVKNIQEKFDDCTFVAYVFNKEEEKEINQICKKLKIIYISNINDLYNSSEIFISNRNYDFKQVLNIENYIILNNSELTVIAYDGRLASTKLVDYELRVNNKNYTPYINDAKKLGLDSISNLVTEIMCYQVMNLDKNTFDLEKKTFNDMSIEIINQSLISPSIKTIFIKANKLRVKHEMEKQS
jgi:hypothetical protein